MARFYNEILFDKDATGKLHEGVRKITKLVGITLGAGGRNVISHRGAGQTAEVINDGVTIARNVKLLADPYEDLAAQMIKDAAITTLEVAGDGTTTSMVLAGKIVELGFEAIDSGYNPMKLRKEIEEATQEILEHLISQAQPLKDRKDILRIATISSGSSEVALLIKEVLDRVGDDGIIAVEQDLSINNFESSTIEGMQFDRGWVSPHFVTEYDRMSVTLNNPYILIVDGSINSTSDVVSALAAINNAPDGKKELLVIADQITGEALDILSWNALNTTKGAVRCVAIQSPTYGDQRRDHLLDIAVATGGVMISPDAGSRLDQVNITNMGRARKVIVGKARTQILEGRGDPNDIKERAETVRAQLKNAIPGYETDKLQQRLAQLTTGIGIIRVGGVTETEARERKLRVEDAIEATKAAIEEGFVAGGGIALLSSAIKLNNGIVSTGLNIIIAACQEPFYKIISNAGEDPETVYKDVRLLDKNFGFDVVTGQFGDMIKMGIIDPVKVVRSALKNASTVAAQLLTSGAAIVVKEDK